VVAERHGRWGRAIRVPGLAALNKGGQAGVLSVSCPSVGNCAAGGDYRASGDRLGFVVSEKRGAWGRTIEVPGLSVLDQGGNTSLSQVSCGSAGNCAAGGSYTDSDGHHQGFTAIERNGVWGQAIEVPGLADLNQRGWAGVSSVSCRPARYCVAVGGYTDDSGDAQAFVVSERNGAWGQAIEVPALGGLNQGGDAWALAASCASAGNCGVGGSGNEQGFVVSERNGVWGRAIEVPGLGALNATMDVQAAQVDSISCTRPGDCLAGGTYGQPYSLAFVAVEKNGVWGKAVNLPGLKALRLGRYANISSVSCAAPGNCGTGGGYENVLSGNFVGQGYVDAQQNGRWDDALHMPGPRALGSKAGFAGVLSVSCGSVGHCTAAGLYTDRHNHEQGFVTQDRP
jgi:hypothetical protein